MNSASLLLAFSLAASVSFSLTLDLAGPWQITVSEGAATATLAVVPPNFIQVDNERIGTLPVFDATKPQYARGAKLAGVKAQECSVRFALDPQSLRVSLANAPTQPLVAGKDYQAEETWGCIARLTNGAITATSPVVVSYRYGQMRIDALVLTPQGTLVLRKGKPHTSLPKPPAIEANEKHLANIYIPARLEKLSADNLFPILETRYPEKPKASPTPAEQFIPKTMAKLKNNGHIRILAWGDSVTDGHFLLDFAKERWQEQFVARLRERYPKATIELITEAWGGRNTDSYRKEPPGSPHNYQEKVLNQKPDVIISEFVNDAGMRDVTEKYGRIRDEFAAIGAEWIILTPHYIRPDWMGLTRERDIDDDPRPYVKSLRQFTAANRIALADASLRWGRLWRQGIPYSTLMMNNINHPDPSGMCLFADALMELFP
jgi:lysophospholipase L1-like esterase